MHDSRRTRLVLGVLLAVAVALITIDARNSSASPIRGLRALGGAIFGTAESVAGAVARPVAGFFTGAGSGSHSAATVSALQREVVQLRGELSQARVSKAQAAQLRSLLQAAGRGRYRIVAANVVAAGSAYEETVTIDAGSADGIKPGETVLNGAGLVGTIASVSAHTATVLLVTDAAAKVGVRVAPNGETGLVNGLGRSQPGPAQLRLQVFDASAVLRPGEPVVTFGGWPYAPGVPVGVITRVVVNVTALTKIAYLRPFADDGALGVVGVIVVPPRHNPRFAVLPPRPRPSTSPTPVRTASPAPTASATPTATGG